MRPPFSAIEPISCGVLNVTRGLLASASLRLTNCSADDAPELGAPGGAVSDPAGLAGVVLPAVFDEEAVLCEVSCGGVCLGGKKCCHPKMITTESTIATRKFFWSILQTSGVLNGMAGKAGDGRNRVVAAGTPGVAAAKPARGQPASLQRPVQPHRLCRVGRAGRLVATGADEEVGERQLVETDRAAQGQ